MNQVFAQTLNIDNQYSITGTVGKFTNIGAILNEAIPFIFAFAGIALLLMLLSAGFNFLTSAGDPKKLEAGKQRPSLRVRFPNSSIASSSRSVVKSGIPL